MICLDCRAAADQSGGLIVATRREQRRNLHGHQRCAAGGNSCTCQHRTAKR